MRSLTLLPAVDVTAGHAVQLVQGVAGSERGYGDPVAAAMRWREQGAQWLHLVDLDAAFGRGSNADVLARVVEAVTGVGMAVEISGGIRDDASVAAALATGARRTVIGTAALERPEWCGGVIAEYGDRVAVGLDVRTAPDGAHRLAARGWTTDGGLLWEALARLDEQGCARYVVTDIGRDGMLQGVNTALLAQVAQRTAAPLVASGGVSSLADIAALRGMVGAAGPSAGVEGAIVGTALYEGAFTLPDALAAARSADSAAVGVSAGDPGSVA